MTQIIGSRWWKFDFHTHTPSSTDTPWHPLSGTANELTPERWLQKYMEAGIDCVAITDHNGGGWIDTLKSEYAKLTTTRPDWFRELTLFPGVEISANSGIHILAIFSPAETTSKVDSLLTLVGYRGRKGDPEIRTEKSCLEVAKTICELGGLCIPAHVDGPNGLLKLDIGGRLEADHQTTLAVLQSGQVAAIEVCDPNWVPPTVLQDSGLIAAKVIGTDCHNFRGQHPPGSRFTWIKMGSPSLEGLRLALLDGDRLSVRRSDNFTSDPNRAPAAIVQRIEIEKLRLMGRPDPVVAPFSPWLTTLIGGRGSGKSTVIDCLRLAMQREGDLPEDMRKDFQDFNRIAQNRRDRGAMTADSRVTVYFERDTGDYRLTWDFKSGQTIIELQNEQGVFEPAAGEVRQRFPIRILSQKEIFAIAAKPQSLIGLVDASPELKLNDWREHNKQVEAKLRRLLSEKRELCAQIEVKSRLQGELEETRKKIELFERGDNRDTLRGFQMSRKQTRILDEREDEFAGLSATLRDLVSESVPSEIDDSLFSAEIEADTSALALIRESQRQQQEVAKKLEEIIRSIDSFNERWRRSVTGSVWGQRKTAIESAYRELITELKAAGIADPSQYSVQIQRQQQLEQQFKQIESAEAKVVQLEEQIETAIGELAEHRGELSRRRQDFLSAVLSANDYVRARILPLGETSQDCEEVYRKAVRKESAMESSILSDGGETGILAKIYQNLPTEPAQRQSEVFRRVQAIKRDTIKMARTGNAIGDCNQWFAKHLNKLPEEQLDDLWMWFPDDVLLVDYRRDTNGESWSPIEQGSPGQKTAAILAFLLSHGNEPIVLDQPEDDLDNHLIYDLIVRQIRESKSSRQIIIATHNPNIVVNGDAEMVLAMDVGKNTQCIVHPENSGCLQEVPVREEVCKVMEGGRDAFKKRYERIVQERWV